MGRVVRAISIAVLAVALLVGASTAATSPIVDAAKRTAAMRTLKMTMTSLTIVPGTGTIRIRGTAEQAGTTSAKIALEVENGARRIPLEGVMLREQGRLVMYMRSPAFASSLPEGKEWMRIDLDRAAKNAGFDLSALVASQGTFGPLEHGIEKTTKVGTGRIAGVRATHYRVVIDVARAAAEVPRFGEQITAIEGSTGVRLRRLDYHVWIDGDGLLRRLKFALPVASGSSTTTMTFTSFNEPVEVVAPPAELVASPPPA